MESSTFPQLHLIHTVDDARKYVCALQDFIGLAFNPENLFEDYIDDAIWCAFKRYEPLFTLDQCAELDYTLALALDTLEANSIDVYDVLLDNCH